MRALLDLMRDNEAAVQTMPFMPRRCQYILENARYYLKILDPEHGEEELINSVAVELAKWLR